MSSKFDRKKIIPRYKIIGYVMVILGLLIVGKALYIATVKRDYWMQVADRLKLSGRKTRARQHPLL